ncbi:MAG: Fic family protein, partial [Holosporaceae bacterium]
SKAPKWTPWVTFFLQTLQAQKRHLATKIEREHKAIKDLPELAIYIIDYVKEHGRVTRRDMVREKGASPNTLKSILSALCKKGYLVKRGGGRSTWYGFPH